MTYEMESHYTCKVIAQTTVLNGLNVLKLHGVGLAQEAAPVSRCIFTIQVHTVLNYYCSRFQLLLSLAQKPMFHTLLCIFFRRISLHICPIK